MPRTARNGKTSRARRGGKLSFKDMRIAIGRLYRPHGIQGEIKFLPFFKPETILRLTGSFVTLVPEDGSPLFELKFSSFRPGGKRMLAGFEGVDSPEEAARLTHCVVQVPRESMPDLPEGRYYYEEIVGLPVFDPGGVKLGVLTGFFSGGEKDVWTIKTLDGGELLVPCTPDTLKEVDLETGKIVIEPMEEAD